MVMHAYDPRTQETDTRWYICIHVNLIYIPSFRLAKTIERDLSQTNKMKQTNEMFKREIQSNLPVLLAVPEMESRALFVLRKCSTTELGS